MPEREAADFLDDMLQWAHLLESTCISPSDEAATASHLQLQAELGTGLFLHSMQCGLFGLAGACRRAQDMCCCCAGQRHHTRPEGGARQ